MLTQNNYNNSNVEYMGCIFIHLASSMCQSHIQSWESALKAYKVTAMTKLLVQRGIQYYSIIKQINANSSKV